MSTPHSTPRPSAARIRLLDAATRLFYEEGIHSVGVDRIIAEAGVTRATLYKQFAGKENLVLAYLEGEDARLREMFAVAAESGGDAEQLLAAVIDGISADVAQHHTRGCPFINAAAEYPDADGPVRAIIAQHREWFRSTLQALAESAELDDAADAAASLVLLRDAALVGGYLDGPTPAFARSARTLIDAHRPN